MGLIVKGLVHLLGFRCALLAAVPGSIVVPALRSSAPRDSRILREPLKFNPRGR
jgi:hypothetical protein